ncbi:hypothetical protein LCGC14_0273040 [marine sediment metagenome]|uniref:Uncharacterized protein n=2 Tax=root TaxID=1 RepID=A0A9C9NDZ0_9HYPH|nr:hypothetical protein [Aurantimonas coralicida]
MSPKLLALIEDAIKAAREEKLSAAVAKDVEKMLNAGHVQKLLEDALLRARLIFDIGPPLPESRAM